jgi:hypothetical protein
VVVGPEQLGGGGYAADAAAAGATFAAAFAPWMP